MLFQISIFLVKLWLNLSQLELWRTELRKFIPIVLRENYDPAVCTVWSILFWYDPACKAWLFWKFIFELEASYSFKITCFLVRKVIYLKKNGGIIRKIYCLVSWSLICTPLIIASALMKMEGTPTTVTYNSMRVDTPGELLI